MTPAEQAEREREFAMPLRPYQQRAVSSVRAGWSQWKRQLGVAATGAGKTIIFSHLAAAEKGRTLILAHREELVTQAVQKLRAATGIFASVEQGSQRAIPGHGVIVASIQSMRRRLAKYDPSAFDLVICDEAHHALAEEWQAVLKHFSAARILGVTATPDRADRRSMGAFFENVPFEISMLELMGEGYLCPLRALRLDVQLDARHLRLNRGEIAADSAAEMISPQLRELAKVAAAEMWDRKTLVFLPRCDVSQRFAAALCDEGIETRHVDGGSDDREAVLSWFESAPSGTAICNANLLTEGYDQPDVDCVFCLRPVQSRAFYAQMVGRGLRTAPGKENCLLLDPLWLVGKLTLCQPADLTAPTDLHRKVLQKHLDEGLPILEAEEKTKTDVEATLAEQLKEAAKNKKAPRGLIDPLAYCVGIHDSDLSEYEPSMPWEEEPPTAEQVAALKEWSVWTEKITRGFAVKLLERIEKREALGLATPKQVRLLKQFGEPNADTMTKGQAGIFLGRRVGR